MANLEKEVLDYANYKVDDITLTIIWSDRTKEELETVYHIDWCGHTDFRGNILHIAVINGSKHLVEFLLETKKLNPNSICFMDKYPTNALALATDNDYIHLIPTLLKNGADCNDRTLECSMTPFHSFCASGYSVDTFDSDYEESSWLVDDFNIVLKSFLDHGAKADIDDDEGDTPLHTAQKNGAVLLPGLLLNEKLN